MKCSIHWFTVYCTFLAFTPTEKIILMNINDKLYSVTLIYKHTSLSPLYTIPHLDTHLHTVYCCTYFSFNFLFPFTIKITILDHPTRRCFCKTSNLPLVLVTDTPLSLVRDPIAFFLPVFLPTKAPNSFLHPS